MSLTYTTLQAAILSAAHRPDLAVEVLDFIRQAEGKIRRDLRAVEVRGSLSDTDRSSAGLYNLPSTLLEVRAILNSSDALLENVGVSNIKQLSASADPLQYAVSGQQVEIRGVPGTGDTLTLLYIGWPAALASGSDTNDLLALHERIYIDGALGYLYEWTQDVELADRAFGRCDDAIERLNQQTGRKNGGASIAGAYNLGNFSTSTGY